jgi:hypothetical protein
MSNDFGFMPTQAEEEAARNPYAGIQRPPGSQGSPYEQDYLSVTARTNYYHPYTAASRPVAIRPKIFDDNGYFMNGPTSDPFNRAYTDYTNLRAQADLYRTNPTTLNTFAGYVNQYGHTNSAGILWALSRLGVDINNPTIQQMLKEDAKAEIEDARQTLPVRAGSPVANEGTQEQKNPLLAGAEFLARNSFAALQMPVEAIQGTIRGIGGAITDSNQQSNQGPAMDTLAYIGSLFMPFMSYAAEDIRGGDNEFINPWEQTEFGQTIEAALGGAGFNAFTGLQGGVDANKAKEELQQIDPNWVDYSPLQQDAIAQQYARDMGYYSDAGWFIDETSRVGEAQRRATFDTWAIPGPDNELTAWTLGRGIFSNVGGPDWEVYSIASGIVDAAAMIFMDPITYIPAVGLPSKAASMATRGGFLVGKELQRSRAARQVFMSNMRKAQDLAAAGDTEQARRLAYPLLKEELGRAPTIDELKDAVNGVTFIPDPILLKTDDVDYLAGVARSAREAEAVAARMRVAAIDEDYVQGQARSARRDVLTADETDRWVAANVRATGGGQDARQLADEWEAYRARIVGTDVSATGSGEIIIPNARVSYVQELGNNEEAIARLIAMTEMYDQFRAIGKLEDTPTAMRDFGNILSNAAADTRSLKPVKEVPAEQLGADMTRIFASREDVDTIVETLTKTDLHGILLDGVPMQNTPVIGALGDSAGLFYWVGTPRQSLKVVSSAELVPTKERQRIVTALRQLLDRDDMRLTDDVSEFIDFDSVAGQMYRKVDTSSDARGLIDALLDDATANYGKILQVAAQTGLDAGLYDILQRGAKGFKYDGITDVGGAAGRTWIGDSTKVRGYAFSNEARAAGESVFGVDDIDNVLAQLDMPQITPVGLGRWGMSPGELDAMGMGARKTADDNWNKLQGYRRDSMFKGYQQDLQLEADLARIADEWRDPQAKFKSAFGWYAGMRANPLNGLTLDEKGVRAFLFGLGPMSAFGGKVLDTLSNFIPEGRRLSALEKGVDSDEYKELLGQAIGELNLVTNNKWDQGALRAVAENAINGGGKSGLIETLAPRLGVEIKGPLSKTIRPSDSDGKTFFRTARSIAPGVSRRLGQMPTARKVNLSDPFDVIESLTLYARYAGIDEVFLAKQIGRVSLADDIERTAVARNVFTETFNEISSTLINNIDESGLAKNLFKGPGGQKRKAEIIRRIRNSTTLYLNGQLRDLRDMRDRAAYGTDVKKTVLGDGTSYENPSILLETEIADGFIGLPSVDEWADGLSRVTLAIDRFATTERARKAAMKIYDNFFRTSLLVFRGAYLIRNLAEMQVRIFLNGHESAFKDPATMIAMTLADERYSRKLAKYQSEYDSAAQTLSKNLGRKANEDEIKAVVGQAPKQSKLVSSFNRYQNTILDTKFNTGLDEARAAANDVEDYFARIRLAHSLTDPRVYNTAVRQGWREVEYGSANFSSGWANELIMLERSGVARLVTGDPNSQQFESIVNGQFVQDAQRRIARELMFGKQYEGTRRVLIAADDEYKNILANEDAVLEYLFLGSNSVFNRIRTYTNADPRLLDYIRTGTLKYGASGTYSTRTYTDPIEKIKDFRFVLDRHFSGPEWENHFKSGNVKVPFMETVDADQGVSLVNRFFEISNTIERIGAVGPEFRMAYWDHIAELAPGLSGADVDRAIKAARTTLSPIQNITGAQIGKSHPAWAALKKAKENGTDGYFTLDEIHDLAMAHAAGVVTDLFYDAARRNNLWWQLRAIFPFGQAHGNTLATWSKLGAKQPLNIYKAQRLFNALQEDESDAIYQAGQSLGPLSAYGRNTPGFNMYDKDSSGGFFYQNEYGDSTFVLPWAGRALGVGTELLARINGIDTGSGMSNLQFFTGGALFAGTDIPIEAGAKSLNLALGGDSIAPGVSPFVGIPLNAGPLSDNELVSKTRAILMPFGDRTASESVAAAWVQKFLAGTMALPVVGGPISAFVGNLAPSLKDKYVVDASAILATSGNYPDLATNPEQMRRFQEDAGSLAAALILTTGLIQNVLPAAPMPAPNVNLGGDPFQGAKENATISQYAIGMLNTYFQQYMVRNGFDKTAALEEWIKDFGPAALFAVVGDWKGFTKRPTSEALTWAQQNPTIAKAHMEIFPYFYPGGDSSDVEALRWLKENSFDDRIRKNPEEVYDEVIGWLQRSQNLRILGMESNGILSPDDAEAAREEIAQRYLDTDTAEFVGFDKTQELEQFHSFATKYKIVSDSPGGQAFLIAWDVREQALEQARRLTGDPDAGLSSQTAAPVKEIYLQQLDTILQDYPDYISLISKFKREWD